MRSDILLAGVILSAMAPGVQTAQAQPPRSRIEDRVDFRGAAVLRGRVQFADGRAAAGVPVVVEMRDSWKNAFGNKAGFNKARGGGYVTPWMHLARAETISAANGSYEFRGLAPAAYDVRAKVREGNRVFAGPQGFAATPLLGVLLQNDKVTRAGDLVLSRGEVVQGRIVDAATGRGLRGLSVGADGVGASSGVRVAVDVTDADGRFSLRLPAGRFEVGVMGGGSASYDHWKFRTVSARRVSDGVTLSAPIFHFHTDGRHYVVTSRAGAAVEAEGAQVLDDGGYRAVVLDAREGESASLTIKAQQVELQLEPRQHN